MLVELIAKYRKQMDILSKQTGYHAVDMARREAKLGTLYMVLQDLNELKEAMKYSS